MKILQNITLEQKKELAEKLKKDLVKLDQELKENDDSFSNFVKEILHSQRDKWILTVEEIELETNKDK